MFCERVIGNLDADPLDESEIDWLDLDWRQCARRALRAVTRSGIELKLVLPIGQPPRHRDILFRDLKRAIAVNLIPTQVLVARPKNIAAMGQLALELGNLHLPVEIASEELITVPDGPTEGISKRLKIDYSIETRRFKPMSCMTGVVLRRSEDFSMVCKPAIGAP